MAKLITVPLVDFALPVPRTGSLDAHSGYGRAAADGQEIHLRVQKRRAKADPLYQAEVPVSALFERQGYRFRIDGRMDGLFRHDPPRIEEIKSGFNIHELARRLADQPLEHPYGLQLLSYGYFYRRQHGVLPALSFHLVSSRSGESRDLDLALDLPLYEKWLDERLDELVVEAQQAQKRAARRRKVAVAFAFPFANPRPGQLELMDEIGEGMAEVRPVLVQAPTGLGKTVGVLHPVLREALGRGQRVVYVTPKNSQHAVAEDAVGRFQQAGARVKSLSITAKAKICFKAEPLCSPEYCEYARDYYAKLNAHGLPGILVKKRTLKARIFRELGEKYQVCPFELQLEGAREADVVICDYNYVFVPRSALGRMRDLGVDQAGKPNLVIDEAHNLPARAMDYYSPALSSATLERMREDIRELPPRFRGEVEELLDGCLQAVASCRPGKGTQPAKIDPPGDRFLEQEARLRAFLSRYLESEVEIRQQDVVLRLCFYWSEFTEALQYAGDPDRQEFFTTFHPHPTGGTVKITCCDASAMLADCYGGYQQVVGFSATLKPFDYYMQLSGIDAARVRTAEFASPFPKERRKLLIIPQVSTKYTQRESNYARIADAVGRIAALRRGNYFVFLPSFDFLDRVAALFRPPAGFTVLRQERSMKVSAVESVLEALRSQELPTIVFAVQGGSFAEGVDYAGEAVIGAFVVGPPLPSYDLEREQMREYYQRRYGAGFDYAYVIPAMAKAVQAAGRVIRSETDRGLIVLMDSRFIEPEYARSMPADWFEVEARELVSGSILGEVAAFWANNLD
ncbi:MAG TPA: ATP-dependent DNA helicase [Desulfuromonadales bacterium]